MFRVQKIHLFWPILLFVSSSTLFSADSADQIAKRLAGVESREWVFKRFETFMGAGNRCRQGESYRFKADHSVIISRCVNGEVHDETQQWSIETEELDTRLKIGGVDYVLKFWNTSQGHFMMLRKKSRTKIEPTWQKTFQLAEE